MYSEDGNLLFLLVFLTLDCLAEGIGARTAISRVFLPFLSTTIVNCRTTSV